MKVKVNGEYLDFNGEIDLESQIFSVETLENKGSFSYSFSVDPTTRNKEILGIVSLDSNVSHLSTSNVSQILTDDGNVIDNGTIIVTDTIALNCSFISGNSDFFSLLDGNVNDIDLSAYDVELIDESEIVNTWTKDTGIVFPIVDRGGLSNRKDAFLKFEKYTQNEGNKSYIISNDFQPFFYIKHAVDGILSKAGVKITGDLISDKTYLSLITTNNSDEYNKKKSDDVNCNIGKSSSQTITDAGYTKVTFTDVTSSGFYNNKTNTWDTSTSKLTAPFGCLLEINVTFTTSDASKLIVFDVRRNGVNTYNDYLRGSRISFKIPDLTPERDYYIGTGDELELYAKVDSTTPGSVNLLDGSIKIEVTKVVTIFAQSLLPYQESKNFIKDIFRLFNVIFTFDKYNKTLTTKFFDNLKKSGEQDLSGYLDSYESERGYEIISNYAKSSTFTYSNYETDDIKNYNDSNIIPFGGGEIAIDNDTISKTSNIFQLNFSAPFSQYYPIFGLNLLKLDYCEYKIISDPSIYQLFSSVTDSGGIANFDGVRKLTNNYYKGTATGILQNVQMEEKSSSNQILALHIPNVPLDFPIRFKEAFPIADGVKAYVYRVTESSIPGYNGDWENFLFSSTDRNTVSLAVFSKSNIGIQNVDIVKQGLSFGDITGNNSLTLLKSNYAQMNSILNNPVKIFANVKLPENVYLNFNPLEPVRLKTKDFNALFFCQKITGYKNSYTPCIMELIKL